MQAADVGAGLDLGDAQPRGEQLDAGRGEQRLRGLRQQPEAVDQLDLERSQAGGVLGRADALVEHQPHVHIGDVVLGQQGGGAELDLGGAHQTVGVDIGHIAPAIGGHRTIEHLPVEIETDLLDLAGLAFAEQFTGAADLEVVGGQGESRAQIVQRGECVEALLGVRRHRFARRRQQVGIGAMVRTAHAPAQLMQLGETEGVGAVDDDGVRAGHVDPRFHDRRAQQNIEAPVIEVEHHRLQLALVHLTVGDADAGLRQKRRQITGDALDVLDLVVEIVDLSAAAHLAAGGLLDQGAVVAGHEGLDRQPRFRRGGDDRQVAQARQAHVERPRDRGRGEREQIDLGAQCLDALLVAHAEAVLLVDDQQAEPLEADVFLQQPMGADDDVQTAVGHLGEQALALLAGAHAAECGHPDGPVGETIGEALVMLLGEQGGRHQHADLIAGGGRGEGRAQRDFGLAEADIAADHAIHRRAGGEIGQHLVDGPLLVGRLGEGEIGGEPGVVVGIGHHRGALTRGPTGLDLQQFGRGVAGALRGLLARLRPALVAEPMQRRAVAVGAGEAVHEMQRGHRHVEQVAAGILDGDELVLHAAGGELDQPAVAADAVVLVHHRGAGGEVRELADGRLGIAHHAAAFLGRRPAAGELGLGDDRQPVGGDHAAGLQRCAGHGDALVLCAEIRPVLAARRGQPQRGEPVAQRLAAAGGVAGDQDPAVEAVEEIAQGMAGGGDVGAGERGHVGGAEVDAVAADLDAGGGQPVQCRTHGRGVHERGLGRQQRPLGIDAALLVARR